MRYSHRHNRCRTSLELKAPVASLNRQPTLKHEVALILGMGMKRRRRVARKQELDQSKAPINYLPGDPDRCQRANEPQPLALPGPDEVATRRALPATLAAYPTAPMASPRSPGPGSSEQDRHDAPRRRTRTCQDPLAAPLV